MRRNGKGALVDLDCRELEPAIWVETSECQEKVSDCNVISSMRLLLFCLLLPQMLLLLSY